MNGLNRKLLILNLSGLLLIGAFSFTTLEKRNFADEQDQRIDEQTAIALTNNYNTTAAPLNSILEAIYLERRAIADINMVLSSNGSADGVSVYFGKDEKNKTANVLVNTSGYADRDDMTFILRSSAEIKICPDFCDSKSPLMGGSN
jgi:hypothetical protein